MVLCTLSCCFFSQPHNLNGAESLLRRTGKFLFLGDYVDRGLLGLEVIAYMLSQKAALPHKVFMLRGNHETRSVNGDEGWYGQKSFFYQCKTRFGNALGEEVYEEVNRVFDRLPLAAVIDGDIFCVHGGIPRPMEGMTEIEVRSKACTLCHPKCRAVPPRERAPLCRPLRRYRAYLTRTRPTMRTMSKP